MADENN